MKNPDQTLPLCGASTVINISDETPGDISDGFIIGRELMKYSSNSCGPVLTRTKT